MHLHNFVFSILVFSQLKAVKLCPISQMYHHDNAILKP